MAWAVNALGVLLYFVYVRGFYKREMQALSGS
jgi:hypothetical protein